MRGERVIRWLPAVLLTLLLVATARAAAPPTTLSADARHISLEGRLAHFADPANTLGIEAAQQQEFVVLPGFRSLGYNRAAHWFHIKLQRAADAPGRWILAIGMPALEEVDVWVALPEGDFRHYALGYHRPYENRPLQTRLFAVPIDVAEHTDVYFRVRTNNAINVNAAMWQPGAFVADETRGNFYRGLYFGILLIAMALYAILGAWMRDAPMAAYAGYIASLVLLHLGATGYLPVLIASDAAWFADALPRIGWLGGAISIVLMWDYLLELKRHHPRIHRLYQFTVLLNLALLPFALMPSLVTAPLLVVVKLANLLNSLNIVVGLLLVLLAWRRSRRVEPLLYFVAFVIPALGTLINTAANQGALPQNALTSNLYQIAPLVHVLVMSLGLALRLRQMQRDKGAAEQDAAVATRRAEEQRRFVAMLSHEFRNPLAAIDRAAQMLNFKLPYLAPPEAQRLGQIRGNVAALSGLVDNFLLTEALEHKSVALARESCELRTLLEGVAQMQREEVGARIVLTVTPPDAAFDLDPTLIGMAVGNLVGNALRYAPPDSPVEISATLEGEQLLIRVADRGPGMGADELARLGMPYTRAGSSLGKPGSGLGLYFTRRIVEAHGGSLLASIRPGGGLAVDIILT